MGLSEHGNVNRTSLEEVHRRLEFNVAAYGQAWTGEGDDTKFIVQPLLDEVERLRAENAELRALVAPDSPDAIAAADAARVDGQEWPDA